MLIFSVSFQFYQMIAEANPKNTATKNLLHFSICACHPCAGAMLIFSVSFQFYRMIAEANPKTAAAKNFLDLCVSSLRRSHANLLCIVPILSDNRIQAGNIATTQSPLNKSR